MIDQLPMTIEIHAELSERFVKINSVIKKLEAQLNFQTLKGNWYGDEENTFFIQLFLETPETFMLVKTTQQKLQQESVKLTFFSDDVFNRIERDAQTVRCYIAITSSEQILLQTQPKLLFGLLQAKLYKVINLIATQQSLTTIPNPLQNAGFSWN